MSGPPPDRSVSPESGVADVTPGPRTALTQDEHQMIHDFSLVSRQLSPDLGIVRHHCKTFWISQIWA